MAPQQTLSSSLTRCHACRNTLDIPGQTECEECHTKVPEPYESYESRDLTPKRESASPIDLTDSPLFSFTNTKETAIMIPDSDPDTSPAPSYRTTSSSPLPTIAELVAKSQKGQTKPRKEARPIKQEEEEEVDMSTLESHDMWAFKPRPIYPGQLDPRRGLARESKPSSAPPTPTAQPSKPRILPHAMTIAGIHQESATSNARKERERPNAGSFALSHRLPNQPGQPKFGSQREIVQIALFEVQGYYAQPSDKELDPPFLTPSQYRVIGMPTLSSLIDRIILILYF
jgi:hypothetical protein